MLNYDKYDNNHSMLWGSYAILRDPGSPEQNWQNNGQCIVKVDSRMTLLLQV